MPRRRQSSAFAFPLMAAQVGMASFEVIARRTVMMATGACSPAEYRKMVAEKKSAAASSTATLLRTGGRASAKSLLAPWHKGVTANVKRLRKK